jgi:hypothetical protein
MRDQQEDLSSHTGGILGSVDVLLLWQLSGTELLPRSPMLHQHLRI